MDETKLSAVRDWPTPTSLAELRRFVGLCNFFRRLVANFSEVDAPLHEFIGTAHARSHPGPFCMEAAHLKAFTDL